MEKILEKKFISNLPTLIFSQYETGTTGIFFTPHYVTLHPDAPYFIILLCLMPDDFSLSNAILFYSV
jgi:hypothetical protein